MMENKRCLIVGAGLSGLVTAKELLDVGIEDVTILEQEEDLGGVWRKYCWSTATLTSSKWITEFGSYPMPDDYPDFPTPEQMMEYLRSFANKFGLEERVRCGITLRAIERKADGKYDVVTNDSTYRDYDFVVLCTGLHGEPNMPALPGLDLFRGKVLHGSKYKTPEAFQGKRVLCTGLGESGIGINSEISSVAARTVVSATSYTPFPRIYPFTCNPIDQMMYWPIGQYMGCYQEILTFGMSWYTRLPKIFKPAYARFHRSLRWSPKEWLPEAMLPYRWHGKHWTKPGLRFGKISGNLTRPEAPTDDILFLVHSKKIVPKGRVVRFDETSAYFEDGSREEVDALVVNTGYKPTLLSIKLPNDWKYRHLDLYKGCFHPEMPNLAFVGLVRPTIGSIPAMAEMQARFVAQVFANKVKLPEPQKLEKLIKKEATQHTRECPTMQERLPHVYFFDRWMEEMAELIGCRPRIGKHLSSWKQLQAYLLGAPIPLRFRLRGPGAIANGYDRYAARVAKIYGNRFGAELRNLIFFDFFYPNVLALLLAAILFWVVKLSAGTSLGIAILFWVLYMKVDLFRYVVWFPVLLRIQAILDSTSITAGLRSNLPPYEIPNYKEPKILQTEATVVD
ncbi:MAG: NAD(P)-binding domain-containing protein [Moorea sp. SIOASIH]|uniref:flavin-containing monooxygenase n=1 Tax=Moorena sp. SIOASIH TaxID=2607817 RepID=UPI0013B67198|nr:NAD(P)-binding domain-containing protein [Moorena sp. SIOASIH]NEO37001.1 NAD(P)-binding domain-containing protein [Moorena sp. SIOASIH]